MPYETTCPKGHRLQVSDAHLGQRIQCPACNESFIVPDGSKPEAAAKAGSAGTWKPSFNVVSELNRLSLWLGRPMVAVGLILVLLSKGCDTVGKRGVDRAEAFVQKATDQFNDDWKLQQIELQNQIDDLKGRGDLKGDDQKKVDDLNRRLGELTAREAKERKVKESGEWRTLDVSARAGKTSYKINGYWRELFFVFASVVLSLGLLIVSWGAEGAERWVTLMMLVIITFSLFIGGAAWMAALR